MYIRFIYMDYFWIGCQYSASTKQYRSWETISRIIYNDGGHTVNEDLGFQRYILPYPDARIQENFFIFYSLIFFERVGQNGWRKRANTSKGIVQLGLKLNEHWLGTNGD